VSNLELSQAAVAKVIGCGVGHPNRPGAGKYPDDIISAVAQHWVDHVTKELLVLGIPRHNEILPAPDSTTPGTPLTSASIVNRVNSLLSNIANHTTPEETEKVCAQQAIRTYGRLRPVVQEALFAMAAISGDPELADMRLSQARETLNLTLQRAVAQSGIPGLEVVRGIVIPLNRPTLVDTQLPVIKDKFCSIVLAYSPHPSARQNAPPSCDVHACRAHDGSAWFRHIKAVSTIFELHKVPFISSEPFPSLESFPPPLEEAKPEHNGPVHLPSLVAVSTILSYVVRTFISLSIRDPKTLQVDPVPLQPSFRLESAMFWYNQIRGDICTAIDQLVIPEIAHANLELIPVLQRMADYLRKALECVEVVAGEQTYYKISDREPVLPGWINADSWMPRLLFHMNTPLEYPGLIPEKEEEEDWNMLPPAGIADDPSLSSTLSSEEDGM
jgi:hypothetical protein